MNMTTITISRGGIEVVQGISKDLDKMVGEKLFIEVVGTGILQALQEIDRLEKELDEDG